MAHIWADRVQDTTTTTGTGPVTVSGTAPTGFRTFSAVCATSDTIYYCIEHQTVNEWEVGRGTYSASNQLTRTVVYASSNAGSAVNFSAGTKLVYGVAPAEFHKTVEAGLNPTPSIQVFTSSGTWTNTGFKFVKATVIAGGGGGGGSHNSNDRVGGGGGGGGCAIKIVDVSALSTVAVTVGAAGTAGTSTGDGGDGGSSSFGAHCSATGGTGGLDGDSANNGSSAAGGTGTGGDINLTGGAGSFVGGASAGVARGIGGDAPLGYGFGGPSGTNLDGGAGQGFGAGGGAGHRSTTSRTGGAGTAGIVIVEGIS